MTRSRSGQALAVFLSLVVPLGRGACAPPASKADGPARAGAGWRGDGTGRYPKAAPPLEWSADRNVLWRTTAGKSHSSPVVVGGRVFVTAEPDTLICLDAASGKVLWRQANGAAQLPAALREPPLDPPTECGYATPTPCSDGGSVCALFGHGVVACYDLAGRRRWIERIRIEQTEEHGRSASPVLVGGRLIVHVTDLFCLDVRTGKRLWRAKAKTAFGTPLAARVGGADVVITPAGDVFRAADGKKVASGLASLAVASPVAGEGVVYFIGSVAKAVRVGGRPAGGAAGTVLWTTKLPGAVYASPVLHGGRIYTVTRDGRFAVLDARTGKTVVSRRLEAKSDCSPSLCIAGGRLFLGTDAGATFVLTPTGECAPLRTNRLPAGSSATPVFSGGRVYLRSGPDVLCVESKAAAAAPGRTPAGDASTAPARPRPPAPPRAATPLYPPGVLSGWRGNGTGLFPGATPVVEWGRTESGIVSGLKISAPRPGGEGPGAARPLRNQHPREWLVVGPFPAPKGLDGPALADEADARPSAGDRAGGLAWKRCDVPDEIMPPSDRASVCGAISLRFVEPYKVLGDFKAGHLVYAHTYLHAARAGEADLVIGHTVGLKVLLNGREIYKDAATQVRLSWYTMLGRFRTGLPVSPSPRVRLRLRKGWNRLLLKLCHGRGNWDHCKFNARIVDVPAPPHAQRNILWAAPLPDRSSGTPILVGDRIFVLAEPDQLLCLDKRTGRQLWTRFLGRYQATPKAVRDANPALREKLEPLVARLPRAEGLRQRMALRREIDAALVGHDPKRYTLKWDGHMKAHFRIVGWTVTTPCSDGKFVYVYCGNGVAACYDLAGKTRWIRRVNTGMLYYPASPALVDGKFVVFSSGGFNLVALDAATGAVAWRQPKADRSIGAVVAARVNGVGVVVTQGGDVVRAADGTLLYANPMKRKGDTGWAPPACLDGVVYLPWCGLTSLVINDFRSAAGDTWTCRQRHIGGIAISRDKTGKWVDRWTCGSPLVHGGIYYNIDVFGTLYAVDLKTGKCLYRRDLSGEFDLLTHYNAVGVAASITLGGRHLFAMDNQGTTVVFEPGATFRKAAVNRIRRQVYRPWPIRTQEEIGYSPPLFEGSRMYLRGERWFYCIGSK